MYNVQYISNDKVALSLIVGPEASQQYMRCVILCTPTFRSYHVLAWFSWQNITEAWKWFVNPPSEKMLDALDTYRHPLDYRISLDKNRTALIECFIAALSKPICFQTLSHFDMLKG
jgi:hypothetical protein